jgi:hypothetical protein
MKVLILIGLIFTGFALHSCIANKTFYISLKESGIKFESIFGYSRTDSSIVYCLQGSGFFRADRSQNSDSFISDWILNHPGAIIVPVSAYGPIGHENKNSKMVYCIMVDKEDTINNYLVRNGCFPGGTMMRPETYREMSFSRKKIYSKSWESHIEVFMSNRKYKAYLKQLRTAEQYARDHKLGIWAKENKQEQ